jgi:hypothetical protein
MASVFSHAVAALNIGACFYQPALSSGMPKLHRDTVNFHRNYQEYYDARGTHMNQYRVTKYNPALRDPSDSFTGHEWTSVADIGRSFAGVILTGEEYGRVEQAYASAALAFLGEAGLTELRIEGFENPRGLHMAFDEGTVLSLEHVGEIVGRILREEFWCRLEGDRGFLHFGWDFYMYVGVPHPCLSAQARAVELGLYVEEFLSPYNERS